MPSPTWGSKKCPATLGDESALLDPEGVGKSAIGCPRFLPFRRVSVRACLRMRKKRGPAFLAARVSI
jgi:hypothetical protein